MSSVLAHIHGLSLDSSPEAQELVQDALFFTRELETTLPTVYEKRRSVPTARALLPLIPISDPDADNIRVTAIDWVGDVTAGRVGWKHGMDTPSISPSRSDSFTSVRSYKGAVEWEDRVLRRANRLGLSLETAAVEHLMKLFLRRENSLLWTGDTAQTGIYGVFNHPDVGTTNLPSSATWDGGATAAEIYADLIFMAEFIPNATSEIYMEPPTLLLPWKAYQIASQEQYAAGTDTTVLQYFLKNAGHLVKEVIPVRDLGLSTKKALVYYRDPTVCGNMLVRDVYQYAPMRYSAGYSVDYQMDTGGFVVFDSLGIRAFDQLLT